MARQQPIELFMPPNMLKAKTGGGTGGIDMAALKRAEAAMENLKGEFVNWIAQDVRALMAAAVAFKKTGDGETLMRAAHDMKGQAATFDYPLMGRVAGSLSRLLGESAPDAVLSGGLIDAHIAAIQVIFRDKITDPANPVALMLCQELDTSVAEALK